MIGFLGVHDFFPYHCYTGCPFPRRLHVWSKSRYWFMAIIDFIFNVVSSLLSITWTPRKANYVSFKNCWNLIICWRQVFCDDSMVVFSFNYIPFFKYFTVLVNLQTWLEVKIAPYGFCWNDNPVKFHQTWTLSLVLNHWSSYDSLLRMFPIQGPKPEMFFKFRYITTYSRNSWKLQGRRKRCDQCHHCRTTFSPNV